jgi:hypothetical protein
MGVEFQESRCVVNDAVNSGHSIAICAVTIVENRRAFKKNGLRSAGCKTGFLPVWTPFSAFFRVSDASGERNDYH